MNFSKITIKGEPFALVPLADYQDLLDRVGDAKLDAGVLDLDGLTDAEPEMAAMLGASLRAAREVAGLTQDQLAVKLRKSQAMVSSAERGTVEVGVKYVHAVLKACGLPPNWNPRTQGPKTDH